MSLPVENPRPPNGEYALQIDGDVYAAVAGTFRVLTGPDVALSGDVDARPIAAVNGQDAVLDLAPGPHHLDLLLNLTERNWRFVPLWNGADLFASMATAVGPLTRAGAIAQRAGRWVTPVLIVALLAWWSGVALRTSNPGAVMLIATASLAAAIASARITGRRGDVGANGRAAARRLCADSRAPAAAQCPRRATAGGRAVAGPDCRDGDA